jgi:flagellar L-ring protein precursor FlgH
MRINVLLFSVCLMFFGCASITAQKLPPEPPKYVYHEEKAVKPSPNSLWRDSRSLFEDARARGLNDLVTIKIIESATASKKAETATSRDSSMDAGIDKLFGMPLNFNKDNFFGKGNAFSPEVKGSMKNDFKGKGETTREGSLVATITAKVVEVLPNGNFVIESRKEITVNKETQILVLRGVIRPEDIGSDNTVLSTYVADAQMFFTGKGVIQDKQSQGWLVRIMDKVWPF